MKNFHYFKPQIAEEYGVDCAIVFNLICLLIESNRQQEFTQYKVDGKWHCKASYKILASSGGYYSEDQIKRLMKKLKDCGLIESAMLKKEAWDRTNYYCLTPLGESLHIDWAISPNREIEKDQTIERNHPIESADSPTLNRNNISSNKSINKSSSRWENYNSDGSAEFGLISILHIWYNMWPNGKKKQPIFLLREITDDQKLDLLENSNLYFDWLEKKISNKEIGENQKLAFYLKRGDYMEEPKKKKQNYNLIDATKINWDEEN